MKLKLVSSMLLVLAPLSGFAESELLKARDGFKTELVRKVSEPGELSAAPDPAFSVVKYSTPIGEMQAYLSQPKEAGKKRPAIIWITGGMPPGGVGEWLWESRSAANDQTALAYHDAGVIMMYPSFRGACGNPGNQESFLGEVDDVVAALDYLKTVPYVDPDRIYLGGHSTGGTLALLVAEATTGFKAVLAFGPVSSPSGYGADSVTYDVENKKENELRSPINYLESISTPTIMIEGTDGNRWHLDQMAAASENKRIQCFVIKGASHFDLLHPLNAYFAGQIMAGGALDLSEGPLQSAYTEFWQASLDAEDLETLTAVRAQGTDLGKRRAVSYYFWSDSKSPLEKLLKTLEKTPYANSVISVEETDDGEKYALLTMKRSVRLMDLNEVFNHSRAARKLAERDGVNYSGWFVE